MFVTTCIAFLQYCDCCHTKGIKTTAYFSMFCSILRCQSSDHHCDLFSAAACAPLRQRNPVFVTIGVRSRIADEHESSHQTAGARGAAVEVHRHDGTAARVPGAAAGVTGGEAHRHDGASARTP